MPAKQRVALVAWLDLLEQLPEDHREHLLEVAKHLVAPPADALPRSADVIQLTAPFRKPR